MEESTPKGVQLSRRRGYRKPEGAVVVARPSKWGNPFSLSDLGETFPSLSLEACAEFAVNQLEDLIRAGGELTLSVLQPDGTRKPVTYTYPREKEIRAELAGKDLACWCSMSMPCHRDLLLEIANGGR